MLILVSLPISVPTSPPISNINTDIDTSIVDITTNANTDIARNYNYCRYWCQFQYQSLCWHWYQYHRQYGCRAILLSFFFNLLLSYCFSYWVSTVARLPLSWVDGSGGDAPSIIDNRFPLMWHIRRKHSYRVRPDREACVSTLALMYDFLRTLQCI